MDTAIRKPEATNFENPMTIAVVWQEENALWAVADTRLSAQGTATAQRITDHGPKLFPLAVTVRVPGSSGFFNQTKLQTSIGYLYAGYNGPALATHSLCSAVLQSLITSDNRVPSLCEIANFICSLAQRYMRDWAECWPNHWKFTVLIFGWCTINRQLQTYKLAASIEGRILVTMQRLDTLNPVAIGSGVEEFAKQLEMLRSGSDAFRRTARLPLLAVEQLVARNARDDVGGDVQIGYVTSAGLQILGRVRPVTPGQPKAKMTFLGIDELELGDVGPCRVGLSGIA